MPELPEVEIIKRELEGRVLGATIEDTYQSQKLLRMPMPDLSRLIGEKIISVQRRNKYIVIQTIQHWIVIHLGMTGRLTIESDDVLKKHTHYRLKLSDKLYIKYEDARRFGLITLYEISKEPNMNALPLLKSLGVEPFGDAFTPELVYEVTRNRKIAIKKLIMDSNIICGIGNIYASEILFLCGLHPLKNSNEISKEDASNIYRHTKEVLSKSISLGGSSISDYVHTNGAKGEMQNFYNTYGRYGQECKVCKTSIEKENVGGRTAYFCPTCQHI